MSGYWIEQDENGNPTKVVTSQPERGVQLAGDGQAVTPEIQARIDAARTDLAGDTGGVDLVRGGGDAADGGGSVVSSSSTKRK